MTRNGSAAYRNITPMLRAVADPGEIDPSPTLVGQAAERFNEAAGLSCCLPFSLLLPVSS